jgi:hypothetical protein
LNRQGGIFAGNTGILAFRAAPWHCLCTSISALSLLSGLSVFSALYILTDASGPVVATRLAHAWKSERGLQRVGLART